MADINVTISGIPVVLTDDLDGSYSIDLSTQQARQFMRAERDALKADRATQLFIRDRAAFERDTAIDSRDVAIAKRDAAVAEATLLLARIDEIRAFLAAVGDDPDA